MGISDCTEEEFEYTRLCKLQKGCTRLAAASDKVYQLLAHGRWFSTDTPASSTTKTGRHDIAEILLKVALEHKKKYKTLRRKLKRESNTNPTKHGHFLLHDLSPGV